MNTRPDSTALGLRRTVSRQTKKLWILSGALGVLLLPMLTLSIQDQRFAAHTILAQGITVPAVITDLPDTTPQNNSNETRHPYQVGVRFTDRDGKAQEQVAWQFINRPEYGRLHSGDTVDIVYLPHRTYTPYLKDSLARVAGSGWLAALTGIGTVVAFAAMIWGFLLKAMPGTPRPDDTTTQPPSD